jgi:hypothetical protein
MSAQNIFKPGERIALPYLPILRIENDVAILKKSRFAVGAECGARHRVRVEAPFFVRGGFKVFETTKYKVPSSALEVRYKTQWGTYTVNLPKLQVYIDSPNGDALVALAKKLLKKEGIDAEIIDVKLVKEMVPVAVYARRFKHVEVVIPPDDYFIHFIHFGEHSGDTYFIYEFINENEAKLVDDVSRIDYVLHIFGNSAESRAGCATIKILGGDVIWSDVKSTCCKITSSAVAMVIARYGSRVTVAYNKLPYRGCCESWIVEEWISEFPPRRISQYDTTDPTVTDLKPEEVV